MVKPTPKPWRVEQDRYGGYRVVTEDGTTIATVMLHTASPGTGKANAHFMATAWQMLDALEVAEGHLNKYAATHPRGRCKVLGTVRAAIAKAEGEQDG